MHIYLGHWEQHSNFGGLYWRAPGGNAIATLDLRTIPQMSAIDRQGGLGIFGYEAAESHDLLLLELGDPYTPMTSTAHVKALLNAPLGAVKPIDIIAELLLEHGDSSGEHRHKPLASRRRAFCDIIFGPIHIRAEETKALKNRIAIFQNDYRRLRRSGVDTNVLARVIGAEMLINFGKMSDENAGYLLPREFQKDAWAEPATTITDSFNRANAGTLGSSSEGWSWSEVQNSGHSIASNTAESAGALDQDKASRADSDLSTADHYSQVDVVTLPQPTTNNRAIHGGADVRFAAAATTFYRSHLVRWDAGAGANKQEHWLWKMVAGTATQLGTQVSVTISLPDTIKTQSVGSTITTYFNGVQSQSLTDTAITGNLRTGISGFNRDANYQLDAFSATDVVTGRTTKNTRTPSLHMRDLGVARRIYTK